MTSSIKIYVLLTLVGSVVCPAGVGPEGHSLMCRACDRVTVPSDCHFFERCRGYCGTDVWYEHGQQYFTLSCKDDHECFHHVPKPTHTHPCSDCCESTGCELNSCAAHHPTIAPAPTTPAPTTPAPTTTTTPAPTITTPVPTTQANLCRNIETNGFQCSDMDPYNFCTDKTGLAHMIAFEKCPLHCGICRIGAAMPTTQPITTLPAATATSAAATTMAALGRRSPLSYNLRKRKIN